MGSQSLESLTQVRCFLNLSCCVGLPGLHFRDSRWLDLGGAQEFTFQTISQIMLILLIQGPQFENLSSKGLRRGRRSRAQARWWLRSLANQVLEQLRGVGVGLAKKGQGLLINIAVTFFQRSWEICVCVWGGGVPFLFNYFRLLNCFLNVPSPRLNPHGSQLQLASYSPLFVTYSLIH